jgi:hypothetical protein
LEIGDQAERNFNFGYLPFGGEILLYLPEGSTIHQSKNEDVLPGELPLASYPISSTH